MMGKNEVKYLFRSTCRKIGELLLVPIGFSKELSHKDSRDVRFLKNIVMMGKNDIKVLRHKDTIGN